MIHKARTQYLVEFKDELTYFNSLDEARNFLIAQFLKVPDAPKLRLVSFEEKEN